MLGEDVNSQGIAVQCTGHNVDHSIHTSDGKDTFHGVGMVAALTQGRTPNPIIPRRSISELKYADRNKQGLKRTLFNKTRQCNIQIFDKNK